jgi:hypothetical protein
MAEIVVVVTNGDEVTEEVTVEARELEAAVDADIAAFDVYFQEVMKNDPLIPSERAMLKTYLWFKTHPEKHDAQQASSSEHV